MLNTDDKGKFRLAALQSETGRQLLARCGRSQDDISSIVLVEESACHIKSDAVLRIGRGLNLPLATLSSLGLPIPGPLRDAAYDQVMPVTLQGAACDLVNAVEGVPLRGRKI